MTGDVFTFRARRRRVVDGDTFDVTVDLGFRLRRDVRLRLAGVDTGEIYGTKKESDEYEDGMKHKRRVQAWFDAAEDAAGGEWPLRVSTSKTGKYGRYVADVRTPSGRSLAADLIDEYPAVEDDGGEE